MASNMLSPGVKVTISDFSDYVAQASTSTIGIVGGARRGPLGPTLITSRAQALKTYGNPSTKDYGIYSLLAALENSESVYYNRVIKTASKASAGDPDSDLLLFYGLDTSTTYNGAEITITGTVDSFSITVKLGDTTENYTNLTKENVATSINGKSEILTVEVNAASDARFKTDNYELSGGASGAKFATVSSDGIDFVSKNYDSTINGYTVKFSEADFLGSFTYDLVDQKGTVVEELTDLSTNADDNRYFETYINNNSEYINCTYESSSNTTVTGKDYKLSGGADGIDGLTSAEIIKGLDQFSSTESYDIDIICAPGWSDPAVISEGVSICEDRQDALYIIDPPFGLKAQQVVDWSNAQGDYQRPNASAYNSSYAAIYWPWVEIYDTFTDSYLWLPPSGYVASQMAYSDNVGEPWFAPAGLNRGKLTTPVDIEYNPTKGERDILYGNRNVVNPIINYRGSGLVIWGQKTTQRKTSALDRVNVRRLVNYIKKIITASTMYYVFEPNDEYCWQKWVDMVDPTLSAIKSRRGVYDYKIIMDETTVTADDIENSRMPGIIMFKPTKASEFIPLDFQIMPYSANFSEEKL
jgi:phage tail sheath protein FI